MKSGKTEQNVDGADGGQDDLKYRLQKAFLLIEDL